MARLTPKAASDAKITFPAVAPSNCPITNPTIAQIIATTATE